MLIKSMASGWIANCVLCDVYHFVVVIVKFEESRYIINETHGLLQSKLILSEPFPNDVIIHVKDSEVTATGESTNRKVMLVCHIIRHFK